MVRVDPDAPSHSESTAIDVIAVKVAKLGEVFVLYVSFM